MKLLYQLLITTSIIVFVFFFVMLNFPILFLGFFAFVALFIYFIFDLQLWDMPSVISKEKTATKKVKLIIFIIFLFIFWLIFGVLFWNWVLAN
jgi:hypothetical protein